MTGVERMRRGAIAGALSILALTTSSAHAGGQEATGEPTGPLLKADLVRMMAMAEYESEELAHIVRMNCVTFRPTERDRRDLLALPGGEPVLGEIARCRSQGQAAGFSAGIPRANPIRSTKRTPSSDGDVLRVTTLSGDPLGERPAPAVPHFTMVLVEKDHDALTVTEIPPRLENWNEVSAQLLREYRPNVRRPGTVVVRVRVDEEGRAADSLLARSSGDPNLDAAVLATVPVMRFKPAMSRDRFVSAWTELPIAFETP